MKTHRVTTTDGTARGIFTWIARHPWLVMLSLVPPTVLAALQLPKIRVMSDLKSMIPRDRIYEEDKRIRDMFGQASYVIVAVRREGAALDHGALAYARTLVDELELVDGISRVRSLFDQNDIKEVGGMLDFSPFFEDFEDRPMERIWNSVESFPGVCGVFASDDFDCLALLIELEPDAAKSVAYHRIKSHLESIPRPAGVSTHISGMPVFEGVVGDYIVRDLALLIPLASVVVAVVLFLAYRSVLCVMVSLIEIAIVDIWVLGVMGYLGIPLFVIQAMMPVILMGLAVADEVHIFGAYFQERDTKREAGPGVVVNAMTIMWRPVVLTSVTTGGAFLAFLSTSMPPLKSFGALTAFGVICAMVYSLAVTPAAIVAFGTRRSAGVPSEGIRRLFLWLAKSISTRLRWAIVLVAVIVLVAALGASLIYVQDSWVANFEESSDVYRDNEILNGELNGTMTLLVSIDTGEDDGIKEPDVMRGLLSLHERIGALEGVGGCVSGAQVIVKANRELSGEDDIPATRAAIGQYMLLLEGGDFDEFWDEGYRRALVTVFVPDANYVVGQRLLASIKGVVRDVFPREATAYGGDFMLDYNWIDHIAGDQVKTLAISSAFIVAVSLLLLRSLRGAATVSVPVLFAVLLNYGLMGWSGIPLGVATSVFSSIVLGVGIDYAIHLYSAYVRALGHDDRAGALREMFLSAGKAVFWDATVVMAGFSVLTASRMPPDKMLGVMVCLGVTTSIVAGFLLVPIMVQLLLPRPPEHTAPRSPTTRP